MTLPDVTCKVKVEGPLTMREIVLYHAVPRDEVPSKHGISVKTNLLPCLEEDCKVITVVAVDGIADSSVIDYVLYITEEKDSGPSDVLNGTTGSERVHGARYKTSADGGPTLDECSTESTLIVLVESTGYSKVDAIVPSDEHVDVAFGDDDIKCASDSAKAFVEDCVDSAASNIDEVRIANFE